MPRQNPHSISLAQLFTNSKFPSLWRGEAEKTHTRPHLCRPRQCRQWLLTDRGRRAKELVLGWAKQIWTSVVSLERLTKRREMSSGSHWSSSRTWASRPRLGPPPQEEMRQASHLSTITLFLTVPRSFQARTQAAGAAELGGGRRDSGGSSGNPPLPQLHQSAEGSPMATQRLRVLARVKSRRSTV